MKINEILTEGKKGKIDKGTAGTFGSILRFRDLQGYDRVYYLLRLMQASAAAHGYDQNAIKDFEQESWIQNFNTGFAYTEAEHNMMMAALKTVDSEYDVVEPWKQSHEPYDTYNRSPMQNKGPIKLLKKGEKPELPPQLGLDEHGFGEHFSDKTYSKKGSA